MPFPADYGGVIDIYYKIESFINNGIEIILHCYNNKRQPSEKLKKICKKVYYYPRKQSPHLLMSNLPFVVVSRNSEKLLDNLLKDSFPILFEGLHTCFFLDHPLLKNRFKIVRCHNIEHEYYERLSCSEEKMFKRKYLKIEAKKLEKFENILIHSNLIAAISKSDYDYFEKQYNNSDWISAFHQNNFVSIKKGRGDFALYHGNLGVSENNEAAIFLAEKVFTKTNKKLVIAGNNPSKKLLQAVEKSNNIELKFNIKTEEIIQLIQDAQVNVLPTFQATGIKLKLLAALYNGRYCIANSFMVNNTGLENFCIVADKPEEFAKAVESCFQFEFDDLKIQERKKLEHSKFSNKENIKRLIEKIKF